MRNFFRRLFVAWLFLSSGKIVGVIFWDSKSRLTGVWDEEWMLHCMHCQACRWVSETALAHMEVDLIKRYMEREHAKESGSFKHGD